MSGAALLSRTCWAVVRRLALPSLAALHSRSCSTSPMPPAAMPLLLTSLPTSLATRLAAMKALSLP